MTFRIQFAASATFLIAACGSSDMSSSLNHYSAEIGDSIEGVQAALTAHQKEVLAESDLTRIQAMEQKHTRDMTSRMGMMQDAEDSMNGCGSHMSGMGHMMDTQDTQSLKDAMAHMGQNMEDTTAELGRHSRAMHDAADVDAAHAEEQQHGTAMQHMMDGMRSDHGEITDAMHSMAQHGMSMMCPMSSHMHHDW